MTVDNKSKINQATVTTRSYLFNILSATSGKNFIDSNRVLHRLATPQPTTFNRFALLENNDDIDTCVDTVVTTSIVPLNFPLENKTATQHGIEVRSCTGGIMIGKAKGNLKLVV
jgi:hypothetical protein